MAPNELSSKRDINGISDEKLTPDAAELQLLLQKIEGLAINYVNESQRQDTLVVDYKSPEDLASLLDLELPRFGMRTEGIFKNINQLLKYSVRPWNPRFLDKLYSSPNPIGVVSELLVGLLNINVHVYHVSPVATLMEIALGQEISRMIGFSDTVNAGGVTCPGGSASNLLAMVTARNAMFPHIKTKGHSADSRLAIFTSQHGHYSIEKAAFISGMGTESVVHVPTTPDGTMIPFELDKAINDAMERGQRPFLVNATAGTTVLGSFDPLRQIAAIAKKHGLWLHVDGSWGGSVLFGSESLRNLLDGIELVDSFTFNPHKLLGVPLQCSMLILPNRRTLAEVNSCEAQYLFHGSEYDLGDGSLGCGRRADAVKFFLAWKYYGLEGFRERLEIAKKNVYYLVEQLETRQNFEIVTRPQSFNVCFWYIPSYLNGPESKGERSAAIGEATMRIHHKICRSGEYLVDFSPVRKPKPLPPFFRVIVSNPNITFGHWDHFLDLIELHGEDKS